MLYDFGFPMGPFAMSDLAGLDIGWKEEKSSSSTIREVLCENGRRGQKNGRGYYTYDPETRASTPDPEVEQLIKDFAIGKGIEQREVTDQEVLERCLYPMVNEGAKILDEGIAIRGSDIDVVWVNGYGWPLYRGGPMFWADSVGLAEIADKIAEYSAVARRPPLGAVAAAAPPRRRGRQAPDLLELIAEVVRRTMAACLSPVNTNRPRPTGCASRSRPTNARTARRPTPCSTPASRSSS